MNYSLTIMEWKTSPDPVAYEDAVAAMEQRAAAIRHDQADEMVWLLEHPPLYTAGTSAKAADLIESRFPVHQTGRGGQYTYHGPGQRIAYVMMDLQKRANGKQADVRKYVWQLEEWIIRTLAHFSIVGERREGRIGIWVPTYPPFVSPAQAGAHASEKQLLEKQMDPGSSPGDTGIFKTENKIAASLGSEAKIAAIGVRVRSGITYHGVSLNVNPDLSHYAGIVPCGISDFGVTSLETLGKTATMADVDAALRKEFAGIFDSAISAAA